MEISSTSFLHFLLTISKATSVKESTIYYHDLLREIFEERETYDIAVADSEMQSKLVNFPSEKIFRRDHQKSILLSKLLDLNEKCIQLSAIPILGSSGIGKTTLARIVYDDEVVKQHFELRVWMKVDGHELRLEHAAHGILKSAIGISCSADGQDELDEMVRDTLQSQRCLIVIDGIESMTDDFWLHVNKYWFSFVDSGSKVLLTTRSKVVANLVAEEPFELIHLSQDDSFSLWRYLAFDSSEVVEDTSMPIAENLASLCGGIPLLLKLVGSLMRYDHKLRDQLSSVEFFHDPLTPPFDASAAVLLSVSALPSHLRQCFAYYAVFPKGYALKKTKIIDMWIANGLVKPFPGNNCLEDIGNTYFLEFLSRSFFVDITRDQHGDIIEFRVPDLIHKIAEDVSGIFCKNRQLGVIGSIGEDAGNFSLVFPLAGEYETERMATLIMSPTLYLDGSALHHSLLDFHKLQSLDLSCSGIQKLSDDIHSLKELRYLNLSYTLIERLPDSIKNLSQLQTLDLSYCYLLKVLPRGMCDLMEMRHLDLWLCESLSYLPSGIGFLTSLTSMPLFILGKYSYCACLGELELLNQLRGRLEIRNLENVREISEARDAKLDQKNLHHLGLSWSQNADDCFQVLEHLQPNPNLKFLDLTGYMGLEFPRWISTIDALVKISITDCGCKDLPPLGQLPLLKELQLKGMTNLERIGSGFYGDGIVEGLLFPSLQKLWLYDLPMLLEWSGPTTAKSVFISLKTLTIEGCPQLTSLPTLPTLPDLIVSGSNYRILSSLTGFTSLSSLLISDMELGVSNFHDLSWLDSLKKLILCNIKDKLIVNISHGRGTTFVALEHLAILHCHQLTDLCLFYFSSLQKLRIVDCPNLFRILVREETHTPVVELVVEDCPEVFSEFFLCKFRSLRKLIVRNCGVHFTIFYAGEYEKMEKLEYLFISGCPRIERELQTFPSLISHVPCIIVGDHKANYKDMQDLMEVPMKASYEPEVEAGSKSSLTCFGAFGRERRGSFGFLCYNTQPSDSCCT